MKRIALVALLATLAFGCKKGPVVVVKDPGPYQPMQGATIAESSDKSVSILVSSGWKRGSPNSNSGPSLSETMGGLGEGGGELGGMAQSMQQEESAIDAQEAADMEKKGILIWVNDSTRPIPGEERTHYRVRMRKDGPMSLEDAAQEAKSDLLNEGAIQYVELPIGKAARLEAKNTKIDGGELFQVVYLVVNGDEVYNIRFTTQNSPSGVQQIEKEVMNSLRIKPAKAG